MTTIHVEQSPDGFVAFAGDTRARWGAGNTPYEAIGDLMVGHGMQMGIDVEIPRVDCRACQGTGTRGGGQCRRCHGFGVRTAPRPDKEGHP